MPSIIDAIKNASNAVKAVVKPNGYSAQGITDVIKGASTPLRRNMVGGTNRAYNIEKLRSTETDYNPFWNDGAGGTDEAADKLKLNDEETNAILNGGYTQTEYNDPVYAGDFMKAYNQYQGNKGANLYDWMANGSADDWYTFVNDPSISKYYSEDAAKFGDLSNWDNFNAYYNQYTPEQLDAALGGATKADSDLLFQMLGTDAQALTAFNTGAYDAGYLAPMYQNSMETGKLPSYSRDDAIQLLDYAALAQALGNGSLTKENANKLWNAEEAKYLQRASGGNYDTKALTNNSIYVTPATETAYAGGTAWDDGAAYRRNSDPLFDIQGEAARMTALDPYMQSIYGMQSFLPTQSYSQLRDYYNNQGTEE